MALAVDTFPTEALLTVTSKDLLDENTVPPVKVPPLLVAFATVNVLAVCVAMVNVPLNAAFENPKTTTLTPASNPKVLGVTVYVAVVPLPLTVTENIPVTFEIIAFETLNSIGVTPVTDIVLPVVTPCAY
jgi:hypothetical protein